MIRNVLFTTIAIVLSAASLIAKPTSFQERAEAYIAQYKALAMEEQRRSGIPAAITLGQGILETEAGASELATVANNHFGIKCRKDWQGETFAHDDDAPQECFRKYSDALQSYRDHSDYLRTSKRYVACFAIDKSDYASWARELRKSGYATNPKYAQVLTKIIEDFHLQDYTYAALGASPDAPALLASVSEPVAAAMMAEDKKGTPGEVVPEHDTPAATPVYGELVKKDGARGFWAHKGDVLLEYAIQYKVRYAKILEINGLPDAPLAKDQFVFIEKGRKMDAMLAKDFSQPAPVVATSAQMPNTPIAEPAVEKSQTTTTLTPASVKSEQPAATMPKNEEVKSAEIPVEQETTTPVSSATTEAAHNETAAPQTTAATEQPMDEFAKLKARLDQAVYAPSNSAKSKTDGTKPVQTSVAAPTTTKPVVSASAGTKAFHTVAAGETMFGISKRYGVTMKELMELNGLKNFEAIKVGQKLRVK